MSHPRTSPRSGLPIPTSSRPAPPNLDALLTLSESSTGAWERGAISNNARSPPTYSSILSDPSKFANTKPIRPSSTSASGPAASSSGTSGIASSSRGHLPNGSTNTSPFSPRQPRDGYGFRPPSGQLTPTGAGSSGSSPFIPTSGRANDDDDEDHRPDGRNMDSLRQEVREELSKNDLMGDEISVEVQRGTEGLSIHGGIADEEGLGWAGDSPSTSFRRMQAENKI